MLTGSVLCEECVTLSPRSSYTGHASVTVCGRSVVGEVGLEPTKA